MLQKAVTFLYKGVFKLTHRGRSIIIDGAYTTADPMLIQKLRELKFRELEVEKTEVKPKPKAKGKSKKNEVSDV